MLPAQKSPRGAGVGSRARSSVSNLLDVVDDGEELPLGVHFVPASEGESAHALILEVGKDRFDGRHAATVEGTSEQGIKLPAHAFGGRIFADARLGLSFAVLDDGELALGAALRIAQTLSSKRTASAGGDGGFKASNAVAVEEHVFAALVEL